MSSNNSIINEYINKYEHLKINLSCNLNYNNCAVIIEPRKHDYLLGIIKNVMTKLDNKWNLHIFGSDLNEKYLKYNLEGDFTFTNLKINNLDQKTYSLLLLSQTFWNSIKEENILIFQTDSFIVNDKYKIPQDYAFLGASYNYGRIVNNKYVDVVAPPHYKYNINGGFSFRKKSVMIECIQKVSNEDILQVRLKNKLNIDNFQNTFILQEDVFFNHALLILDYKLPTLEICNTFCSQQNKDFNSFGIHGFNQEYNHFTKEQFEKFCKIESEKKVQFEKKKINKNLIIL
jgi:hypothetical protein